MTAHRSQSTPTPAAAAIRQWTGTPAEWDAERDRRVEEMRARVPFVSRHVTDSDVCDLATATMPPRPVEPPSVTVKDFRVTYEGAQFVRTYPSGVRFIYDDEAHLAFNVRLTRTQLDAIRALRDGPAPRYEPLNEWVRVDAAGVVQSCWSNEERANKAVDQFGGTAHAIYRRVEGET